MGYERYTLRQFINAWFNEDYSEIDQVTFEEVKTEYIDTAGLYDELHFEKVSYIYFLSNRVNSISLSIRLQLQFLNEFGKPYEPAFNMFSKYGHRIKWNDDADDFVKQLNRVELKEKKYISQLENSISDLAKLKKPADEEKTPKERRQGLIRIINSLGKQGYKIDTDKTTVEEFALMIKQQKEDIENQLNHMKK